MSEKRVLSCGLWGHNPIYVVGAVKNAILARKLFPDWTVRFYIPDYWTHKVAEAGTVEFRNFKPGIPNMFQRFLVADDSGVDRFVIFDADSRLDQRLLSAVNAWIESGKSSWVARDHPAHAKPIMAGLWGARGGQLPMMLPTIRQWIRRREKKGKAFDYYGSDEEFLGEEIWPLICVHSLQHDSVCRKHYPGSIPFPTARQFPRYLGERFSEDDRPLDDGWKQITKEHE